MKEYSKPTVKMISLQPKENIAGVIPTVPDTEGIETSVVNTWGDEYWD